MSVTDKFVGIFCHGQKCALYLYVSCAIADDTMLVIANINHAMMPLTITEILLIWKFKDVAFKALWIRPYEPEL